jgi:hypothetical protein
MQKIGTFHGIEVWIDPALPPDEVKLVVGNSAATRMRKNAVGMSADGHIDFTDPDWPEKIGRAIRLSQPSGKFFGA